LSTPVKSNKFQFEIASQSEDFTGAGFDPYYDAPAFTNFDSIAKQDGMDTFQAGNCFEFSVLSKLWFHDRAKGFSNLKLEDLEGLETLDGAQYLARKLLERDSSSLAECEDNNECRLGKISRKSEFKSVVRQAVMYHQTTQDKFPKDAPKWNTYNPEKLAQDMQKRQSCTRDKSKLLRVVGHRKLTLTG